MLSRYHPLMLLTLVRTGGVTGMRRETTVDTNHLEAARAREVEDCVGRCGFFELPPNVGKSPPQPDRFQIELTVAEAGRSHTVRFSEHEVPAGLEPLIALLRLPASDGGRTGG